MKKDVLELYCEYLRIKEMGWVKSERRGPGGIGYTFEFLLNKPEDSLPIPDFGSVEIKTMRKNSRRVLHLFNLTPDGDYLFPIKRILDKLGYPDKKDKEHKVFRMAVNAKEYTNVGVSKRIKLYVNRENERLELIAESTRGKDLSVGVSWSFDILKRHLELKLKYLAIVKADNKIIDDCEYFRYNEITFYELIDFDKFLLLIELGIIKVTFNIGTFKSGRRVGQTYDHGTNFSLHIGYLCNLYRKIK